MAGGGTAPGTGGGGVIVSGVQQEKKGTVFPSACPVELFYEPLVHFKIFY